LFWLHLSFERSHAIAALVAMIANLLLTNLITYRDRRLRGWRILERLILSCMACSIGLFINLTLVDYARNTGAAWYVAGLLGLAVGSVWSYGITRV
jgi:dolichol-phosphate mannosyltransferase